MKADSNSQNVFDVSCVLLSRKVEIFEVSVFLFLIVPSMLLSFFAVRPGSLSFMLVASGTILRDLALVSLILFFLWRKIIHAGQEKMFIFFFYMLRIKICQGF